MLMLNREGKEYLDQGGDVGDIFKGTPGSIQVRQDAWKERELPCLYKRQIKKSLCEALTLKIQDFLSESPANIVLRVGFSLFTRVKMSMSTSKDFTEYFYLFTSSRYCGSEIYCILSVLFYFLLLRTQLRWHGTGFALLDEIPHNMHISNFHKFCISHIHGYFFFFFFFCKILGQKSRMILEVGVRI